ncbi:MAG: N-acetylmuramoyl-L-alanine amidase [Aquificae bacterium]|nr:N-acetylmuramoyl-L-alanine amidase [Aquificota bacterium]
MFRKLSVIFLSVFLLLSFALGKTFVKVRYGVHPDKVRVVLDLNKHAKYRVFYLKNPYRVVIDVLGKDVRVLKVRLPKGFKYRVGRHPWGRRIVINPPRRYEVRSFKLNNPPRLVVDLLRSKRSYFVKRTKKKVIVIDPGHGGRDPGAIGYRGLKEKWVNLRIARYLAQYLRRDGRFKVIMTRWGDYYVPLEKRAHIAIKNKAHLFISIHADAAPRKNPRARGTQIFALSHRSALKKKREFARNRYYAQLLLNDGGAHYKDTRLIISDLAFRVTLEESERFARILARELKRNLRREVHFKGIRRAGFVVLKTPGTPSVLIEAGFITNPREARRLRDPRFQKKLAYSIYKAILRYFNLRERR